MPFGVHSAPILNLGFGGGRDQSIREVKWLWKTGKRDLRVETVNTPECVVTGGKNDDWGERGKGGEEED